MTWSLNRFLPDVSDEFLFQWVADTNESIVLGPFHLRIGPYDRTSYVSTDAPINFYYVHKIFGLFA